MSIYIPGMEMPKNCSTCPFCFGANNICPWVMEYATCKGRHKDCPLVPVPPHGRLIDAEAYKSLLRDLGDRNYRREKGTICDAIKFLHPYYTPTIIPADGKDIKVPTREDGE